MFHALAPASHLTQCSYSYLKRVALLSDIMSLIPPVADNSCKEMTEIHKFSELSSSTVGLIHYANVDASFELIADAIYDAHLAVFPRQANNDVRRQ